MRRLALVLTAAALAAPLSGTSHAMADCRAVATPPHLGTHANVEAYGMYACSQPYAGMTVEVCTEELLGGVLGSTWWSEGCTYGYGLSDAPPTLVVAATNDTQGPLYATLLRTVVTGWDYRGNRISDKSAPTVWFNCACMP